MVLANAPGHIQAEAAQMTLEGLGGVVIAGGDGSVNEVMAHRLQSVRNWRRVGDQWSVVPKRCRS